MCRSHRVQVASFLFELAMFDEARRIAVRVLEAGQGCSCGSLFRMLLQNCPIWVSRDSTSFAVEVRILWTLKKKAGVCGRFAHSIRGNGGEGRERIKEMGEFERGKMGRFRTLSSHFDVE